MNYEILEIDPAIQEMEDRMYFLYDERRAVRQEAQRLVDRAWERYLSKRKCKLWVPKPYDRIGSLSREETALFDALMDEVYRLDCQIADLKLRLSR
jgi:hypothetical protein